MNIYNFSKSFPDEDACIEHFKAQEDQNGVVCPKCGSKAHYWLKGKLRYGEQTLQKEFADLLKAEGQSKHDLLKIFEELGYKIDGL
jgi:ssDNA-binding Zn-finger/Zn-ribbon topoisomerase 1